MKQVSEQFLEALNEVVRPPIKLHFEVMTSVAESNTTADEYPPNLDETVAPIIAPEECLNEHYYAILGDGMPVDDPNRICSPVYSSGDYSSMPGNISVPYGVTEYTNANTERMIGNNDTYACFIPFGGDALMSFKGGVIPEYIRVESYNWQTEQWEVERTIHNEDLSETVFLPEEPDGVFFRRFYVKNTTTSGRFQLNWIMKYSDYYFDEKIYPVIFDNDTISSVNISKEIDLTSQSLPSYEMTVECLDVDEIYTPDSEYWNKQFKQGNLCYLAAGFEFEGIVESVPLMFGKLTQKPDYSAGKLTFKLTVNWHYGFDSYTFESSINEDLSAGDPLPDTSFSFILDRFFPPMFDNHDDIFVSEDDEENSATNYLGELEYSDAKQLIANALGGFISAEGTLTSLKNTIAIQYKLFEDYLTRYEQVQNTLESKSKVAKITVSRTENVISEEYDELSEEAFFEANEETGVNFIIPQYAVGKVEIISISSSSITFNGNIYEETNPDGTTRIQLWFENTSGSDITATVTARFYKVKSTKFEESETLDSPEGEKYTNDNTLITNSYVANKVKSVARFISETAEQYEVDVIQDYRYELGDVIRLETQRNKFKTCVITGLNFTLPGSNGHVSCRKIFALEDTPEAVIDANGLTVTLANSSASASIKVIESEKDVCVIGEMTNVGNNRKYVFTLGAKRFLYSVNGGTPSEMTYNLSVTDKNNHKWYFCFLYSNDATVTTDAPVIELPDFNSSTAPIDEPIPYGAITMLKKIYESQGMTAPVDYECEYEIIIP